MIVAARADYAHPMCRSSPSARGRWDSPHPTVDFFRKPRSVLPEGLSKEGTSIRHHPFFRSIYTRGTMYNVSSFYPLIYTLHLSQQRRDISSSTRRIQDMSLLINPTLTRLAPPLQHHSITLHTTRKVIPRHRHQAVFALEVGVFFLKSSLHRRVSMGHKQTYLEANYLYTEDAHPPACIPSAPQTPTIEKHMTKRMQHYLLCIIISLLFQLSNPVLSRKISNRLLTSCSSRRVL